MAPSLASKNKRKRSSVTKSAPTNSPATPRSPPNKRKKKETPRREDTPPAGLDEFEEASTSEETLYKAKCILNESKTKYQIDWIDDPKTGESFKPTWEPKGNANKELVDDWKRRKRVEEEPKKKTPKPASTGAQRRRSSGAAASPATSRKQKSPTLRRRRVVKSASPTPEPEPQLEQEQELEAEQEQEQEPEAEPDQLPVASPAPQDPIVTPEIAPRTRLEVVITQPTDYNPSDYEGFTASQIPWASQAAPVSSQQQQTGPTADCSQASSSTQPGSYKGNYVPAEELLRQPRFADGAVIPDSESLHENSSYIPSTQTYSGQSQSDPTQIEQASSAATQAQQDASASASAEFTQSGQDDSSAPVPETDPIEEVHSSPAAYNHQGPTAEEEPSVPSPESWLPGQVRGTPEEPQAQEDQEASAQIPATAEQSAETASAASDKQTQGPEAREEPKASSPENRPQDQGRATLGADAPEIQEQEDLWIPDTRDQRGESFSAAASEHTPGLETEEELRAVIPTPRFQRQGQVTLETEAQEDFATEQVTQEPEVQEETEHAQDTTGEATESPSQEANTQRTEVSHSEQPFNEHQPGGSEEGASNRLTLSSNPTAREGLEQFTLQQSNEQWQAAQYVPQNNLEDTLSGSKPEDQPESFTHTPVEKRKDSSQASVEFGILSQADPNVVRHSGTSRVNSPKEVVFSVESQPERFTTCYGRRSQGMPHSPQPSSSVTDRLGSETSQLSLTEKLRDLRARKKRDRERKKAEIKAAYGLAETESPSLQDSTRSPSAVPPQGPQKSMEPRSTLMPSTLSAEAQPTRNEDALPDIQPPAGDVEMHDGSTPGVLLDEPILGEAEYLIGLSMEGPQGDQYRKEIRYKKDYIVDFTENENPKDQSLHEVHELLKKVGNLITHMDLGYGGEDALTQHDNSVGAMVAWTTTTSSKFRFLGGVLDRLRHLKLHFVILGRPGALIDIIETFVRGMDIDYSRGGQIDRQAFDARASLFVTIIATDFEKVDQSMPAAHLIFAMDSSVQCRDSKVKALRNRLRGASDSIPVITPIVNHSLEHVERCVATSLKGPVRMKLVVRFMTELRQVAGRVDGSTRADHAVNLLVPSIETDLDHHEAWPLPRVGSIKEQVHFDESMISSLTVTSSATVDSGVVSPSAGQKRHLEAEGEEPAKKARLTPQPGSDTVNPIDITHISDSLVATSQAHGQSSGNNQDQPSGAHQRDERLRNELKDAKQRLEEFEGALGECQAVREEQREQILFLNKENRELKQSQLTTRERVRVRDDTIASLKAERTTLQKALDEARAQLASSTIPAVSEREQLRRERDDAQAKLERAQRAREAESRESDFFRAQYQDAANTATDGANEAAALRRQVRDLQSAASGERERARGLSLRAAKDAYAGEVAQLRAQLKASEDLVKLKDSEVKALRGRQGVGTRAGSVPRSPRVVGGGPGSRGGSPAPSGLGGRVERLRNLNA